MRTIASPKDLGREVIGQIELLIPRRSRLLPDGAEGFALAARLL
jgi:hypothetical protein